MASEYIKSYAGRVIGRRDVQTDGRVYAYGGPTAAAYLGKYEPHFGEDGTTFDNVTQIYGRGDLTEQLIRNASSER